MPQACCACCTVSSKVVLGVAVVVRGSVVRGKGVGIGEWLVAYVASVAGVGSVGSCVGSKSCGVSVSLSGLEVCSLNVGFPTLGLGGCKRDPVVCKVVVGCREVGIGVLSEPLYVVSDSG